MKTVAFALASAALALFTSGAQAQVFVFGTANTADDSLQMQRGESTLTGDGIIPFSISADPFALRTDPGAGATVDTRRTEFVTQPPAMTSAMGGAFGSGSSGLTATTLAPAGGLDGTGGTALLFGTPVVVTGDDTLAAPSLGSTTVPPAATVTDAPALGSTTAPAGATFSATDTTPADTIIVEDLLARRQGDDGSRANARQLLDSRDQAWVAISGTVRFTADDSFVLDHADGSVRVRMEGWNWYDGDARFGLVNDQVRVYAPVTEALFTRQEIEAWSIFIESFGTWWHASDVDGRDPALRPVAPVVPSSIELKGTVTATSGNTITVGGGPLAITVDVSALGDDPLDGSGYLRVGPNDLVVVSAPLDSNFFIQRWLFANFIAVLRRDETRQVDGPTP